MRPDRSRICLITPGHLSSTPRLVREADALASAGYETHVVYGHHYPPAAALDEALLARADWTAHPVALRGTWKSGIRSLLGKIAPYLTSNPASASWKKLALACSPHSLALGERAARIPASLYIGHCLGGLPAAVHAARINGARAGFDLEDFHETETEEMEQTPGKRNRTNHLLRRLLPECRYLTAASPAIGRRCAEAYGPQPQLLLNVYPRREAPEKLAYPVGPDASHPAKLYWFSQTIGPGRGLEEALAVLGLMTVPVELHLRGFVAPGYQDFLTQRSREAGMKTAPFFHPAEKPDRMPISCSGFHLGLSLEKKTPENRDLCLTNKIFAYLLAGLPVWLSETSAQKELAKELGAAALVAEPAEARQTAARLDAWLANRQALLESSQHAQNLAETRFCWDVEQKRFLEWINHLVPLCAS